MKISTLTLASIVAGVLLAGTSAHAQQVEQPRTIGVGGQGEVRAEPDRATVTLGVESRKPKLADARAEVAKTVEAVLKLTRELKIDPKLVRSTRINVQPEYNWNPQANERNLIGYYVSRQVEVELHDLEKLGQLLERATDLGVNQMGDPRLDSSKRQDLVREALAKAVVDARQNAEVIAKAAGAKLGSRADHQREHRVHTAADADGPCDGDGSLGGQGRRAVSERRDDFHRNRERAVRSDPAMSAS